MQTSHTKHPLGRQIMEKSIITPHASQPRIVLATFKCNHNDIRFFKTRPQCLVQPTALSTGRRWDTPRDAAANWGQRFELRVWPQHKDKDCLLMTCRRTITPSSSIAPRMLRILIVSDFLPLKTKSELKEMRNDSLFFHVTVSYYPCNWYPPWYWRINYPCHFWLWLICLYCNTLTLPTTFPLALSDLFYSTRRLCHLNILKAYYPPLLLP
jgi:hypothetical protein